MYDMKWLIKLSKNFNLNSIKAIESHEYHMKIVPTIYEDLSGNIANSFQYTYAYKSHIGINWYLSLRVNQFFIIRSNFVYIFIAFSHHGIAIPAIWFK
jgi:hypothetical protein